MKVSIVLPTYNESGNIEALIQAILKVIPAGIEPEILVVDDNSPDQTYQLVLDKFGHDSRIIPVLRKTDRGLAKSIRTGIEQATGEKIIVMDTDFSHDPVEIPRLIHVAEIYDLVVGSRFCAGGNMENSAHYMSSLVFNWVMRIIIRTQVQDNLGGYFIASRALLNKLPFDLIFFGYGDYFFRLLYFVAQKGGVLVEIPSQYHARTAGVSKSRFIIMFFSYSWAAIQLKLGLLKPNRM